MTLALCPVVLDHAGEVAISTACMLARRSHDSEIMARIRDDSARARYARLGRQAVALLGRHGSLTSEQLVDKLEIRPEELHRVTASEQYPVQIVHQRGVWTLSKIRRA